MEGPGSFLLLEKWTLTTSGGDVRIQVRRSLAAAFGGQYPFRCDGGSGARVWRAVRVVMDADLTEDDGALRASADAADAQSGCCSECDSAERARDPACRRACEGWCS